MANSKKSNQLVNEHAGAALDRMKFEIASELGINLSRDGYHGDLLTRDAGRIGGGITRRLVQMAEQQLAGRF